MQFNEAQLSVINHPGHVLVVAGPGSGKTTLSVGKIAKLLSNSENRVCAVTFTRAAAANLKRRVLDAVSDSAIIQSRFATGTFHSVAINQLKRAGVNFVIAKDSEIKGLLQMTCKSIGGFKYDEGLKIIQDSKSKIDWTPGSDEEADLVNSFQALLDKHGLLMMDDVLSMALRGMKSGFIPPVNCTDLIIDEFQDVDPIQLDWCLAHKSANLTAVGDDDQSVYQFRNSLGFDGMTTFRDTLMASVVNLNINYRCHEEITNAASIIIEDNKDRLPKIISSAKGKGGGVYFHTFKSPSDESIHVVLQTKSNPDNWAILARTNLRLLEIECDLISNQIPYYRMDKESIWDFYPVSVAIGILAHLINKNTLGADVALGYAGLSVNTIHKIENGECHANEIPTQWETFQNKIKNWRENLECPRLCIASVFSWVESYTKIKHHHVLDVACSALCEMSGSIAQRIFKIERRNLSRDNSGVALLTMHSSKGLEFENVWLIGCELDNMPSKKSNINDERRLFYVAMTRAEKNLHISAGGPPGEFINKLSSVLDHRAEF